MSFKTQFALIKALTEGTDHVGDGSEGDLTTHMQKHSARLVPSEVTSSKEVHNALNQAAEEEEVETVTFGLEDENDNIVKVFVNISDADAFEEALSKMLGDDDTIEDILDELSKDYDIVSVQWPEDGEEDEEDAEDAEESDAVEVGGPADAGALETDGSESLNPNVDRTPEPKSSKPARPTTLYKEGTEGASLKDLFARKIGVTESTVGAGNTTGLTQSLDDMDPDSDELDKRYGRNRYVRFAFEVIKAMGFPPAAIEMALKRNPSLARDIRNAVLGLGMANIRRISNILQVEFDKLEPTAHMDDEPADDVATDTADAADVKEGCGCGGDESDAMQMDATTDDVATDSKWTYEHGKDGLALTYDGEYRFEFSYDEMLTLVTGLNQHEKVSFEGEQGEYVSFVPRGDSYIVVTSQTDAELVLDAETVAGLVEDL